jgi:carotenoid cleavage dioxygenase
MAQLDAALSTFPAMHFEATVDDCIVIEGEIPRQIEGGYFRNGPSKRRPARAGRDAFFAIDGMIQGLILSEGKAAFRNRWVRTPKFLAEERAGRALFEWSDAKYNDFRYWGLGEVARDEYTMGIPQGTNFVNVFPFRNEIFAVGEHCAPIAMDPLTLETKGYPSWSGELAAGMFDPVCEGDASFAPHPKWDHSTGTLYGWSYKDKPPYVTLHWIDRDGKVSSREVWDAPFNTFAHDAWLTESYLVIPFQPFYMSLDRLADEHAVLGWDPSLGTVLALIPRDDINGAITWVQAEFETQHILHTMSANEIDGQVILDGPIFTKPAFQVEPEWNAGDDYVPFWKVAKSVMGRWVVDPVRGTVKSERTGGMAVELPKIDERFYGRPYEWGLALCGVKRGMAFDSMLRHNVRTGEEQIYTPRRDGPLAVYEPSFIPRSTDAPEGDGYILLPISHHVLNTGEFHILDTDDISAGPIARIHLPFAMSWTPHGHWMPAENWRVVG